jgi:hypothetical protein
LLEEIEVRNSKMSDIRRGRDRFDSEISRIGTEEMKGRMMKRRKRIMLVHKA